MSSAARDEILGRIRRALGDVPRPDPRDGEPIPRDYRQADEASADARLERFEERLRDYRAEVRRVGADAVGDAVAQLCAELGLRRVVVPAGLPEAWRPRDVELVEDAALSARELDAVDVAVTGCAVAIAETGTIILDGRGASGRRAITLVPDHHVCIITAAQIRSGVPEALADLHDTVRRERVPVTLVSGPSASSDIELSRVEGVHGPRHLVALIVAG